MAFLLVLSLVVPISGALLAFAVGGRWLSRIALATIPLGLALAIGVASEAWHDGEPLLYLVGGWPPPLGLALRADWLSGVMMVTTAIVISAVALFAVEDFAMGPGEARRPFAFWILLLALWAALNTVFLSNDLFSLYVALELLVFIAVPLVALDGRSDTLQAALRYLLFALLGSVLYLAGAGLLYGAYGTLDIFLLSGRVRAEPVTVVAAALMTVGLMAKTALFPLYLWLPAAHAGAPAAASALLSALVVKGSFFIAVRLWFFVIPGATGAIAPQILGALGAGAILFGGLLALRQKRLKLVVAYSTVAQIGYLFLMFPLAFDAGSGRLVDGMALFGGIIHAASHATAKAGMFMAAGMIYVALGHDRIGGLAGVTRAAPLAALTFLLAGVALIGPPTSGVYLAKTLFLTAASDTHQWWWRLVLETGGILTSGYLVLVVAQALKPLGESAVRPRRILAPLQAVPAMLLALCSLLLGLLPWRDWLPLNDVMAKPDTFGLGALWSLVWPLAAGVALAVVLGRWTKHRPLRVALWLDQADVALRQWPAAALSLCGLTILLGLAMIAALP
jgi:formate hydrogenlyase subunit 3/multisubunit Na+/H+ antiporter MnhD subunit